MTTTESPWRVRANSREQRTFDVVNDANSLVDITGWTVDAVIRTRPGGPILYTFPAELTAVVDGSHVTLTIPAPVSAGWAWSAGWYRVRVWDSHSPVEDPDGSRVLQGPMVIDPD